MKEELSHEMEASADALDFELAALLRDLPWLVRALRRDQEECL